MLAVMNAYGDLPVDPNYAENSSNTRAIAISFCYDLISLIHASFVGIFASGNGWIFHYGLTVSIAG